MKTHTFTKNLTLTFNPIWIPATIFFVYWMFFNYDLKKAVIAFWVAETFELNFTKTWKRSRTKTETFDVRRPRGSF